MIRFALCLCLALSSTAATVAPGYAQVIGEALPGRAAPAKSFGKPVPTAQRGPRPCPEYGAGFVRLEGSSLCVRASGAVRVEVGRSSRSDLGLRGGNGSRVDGVAALESRGETEWGPVRSVIVVRGAVDRGLGAGPFHD